MNEKLKAYVDYYFRFDEREDIEEVKAEVLGNLMDRYEEYLDKYEDEQKAYVEAIKSMGDFKEEEELVEDPMFVDTGLLVSLVTAIFALIGVLFSNVLGIVVLMVSISLFVASAYILVGKAKVFIEEEKDIEKSKFHLQKIFSYMKASFTFWSITLSLLGAKLLYSLVVSMAFLGGMNNGFYEEDFTILLILSFVVFVLLLVILLVLSRVIYARLMHQYYLMTGDPDVESKVQKGLSFIKNSSPNEKDQVRGIFTKVLGAKYFVRLYLAFFWLVALPFNLEIVYRSMWNWRMDYGSFLQFVLMIPVYDYTFIRVFFGLLSLGMYLFIGVSFLWKKLSDRFLIGYTYTLIFLYFAQAILFEVDAIETVLQGDVFGYIVLMGLFSLILFVLRMFIFPSRRE
jgi:hypothetical protein